MVQKPIQTRRGSELPEGPYYRNLKESASHHFIEYVHPHRHHDELWQPAGPNEGDWRPRNMSNIIFSAGLSMHTSFDRRDEIWGHSQEAFLIFWNVFDSLFCFSVLLETRWKKMVQKNTQTRWGPELPEGPYYRNLKEYASHHFIEYVHPHTDQKKVS